jgi:hypothetical protein
VLVALIGISLVGRSGAGPGSQAAATGPTAVATATAAAGDSPAATPVPTSTPTAPPTPPPGIPPPRVAVALGPVPTCPPGSTPDEPGPVDQARPTGLTIVLPSLTVDRRAGKLVALTGFDIVETWTFDLCRNTWTRMHPNREPPQGTGQLVYDVDSDVAIANDGTRLWAYDLGANTWTEKGPIPPFVHFEYLLFYDPISGHVVAWGKDGGDDSLGLELWSYEVETDTWTPIPQGEPPVVGPHYEFFAYDASVDRLVAYANAWKPWDGDWHFEARTWLFDLRTGTWSGTGAVTPPGFTQRCWGCVPAIAYDDAAQRTVLLGQGHAAAYDATADRWEILYEGSTAEDCGTRPECRQGAQMVYDPVNERLVVYSDSDGDWLAFDTRTREWTVLLEASPAQPAP